MFDSFARRATKACMSYRYWRGRRSWLTVEHLKVGPIARTVANVDDHYRLLLTSIAFPSVKAS